MNVVEVLDKMSGLYIMP